MGRLRIFILLDETANFCYSSKKEKEWAMLYEETLKRKAPRGFKSFLAIIIMVFVILALMFVVGYVQTALKIYYLQYILLAAVILFAFVIVRKLLTEYVYSIEEGSVRIFSRIGSKQKMRAQFAVRDILHFGSLTETADYLKGKKRLVLTFKSRMQDAIYIILPSVVVTLSPTGEFMQKLKEVYEKADR